MCGTYKIILYPRLPLIQVSNLLGMTEPIPLSERRWEM